MYFICFVFSLEDITNKYLQSRYGFLKYIPHQAQWKWIAFFLHGFLAQFDIVHVQNEAYCRSTQMIYGQLHQAHQASLPSQLHKFSFWIELDAWKSIRPMGVFWTAEKRDLRIHRCCCCSISACFSSLLLRLLHFVAAVEISAEGSSSKKMRCLTFIW